MKIDQELYLVKDLYEASFLYASGITLTSLKKVGNTYFFSFTPKHTCEQLRDSYWANTSNTLIKAKSYADAVKSLKERIFSNPK